MRKVSLAFFIGLSLYALAPSQSASALKDLLLKDPSLVAKMSGAGMGTDLPSLSTNLNSTSNIQNINTSSTSTSIAIQSKNQELSEHDSAEDSKAKNLLPVDSNRFETRLFSNQNREFFTIPSLGPNATYRIKPGDAFNLNIWGEVEKSYFIEVSPSGSSMIPSLGSVGLSGKTSAEAQQILKQRLSTIYSGLNSGKVQLSVDIARMSPVKVFVVGEAARPGAYIFPANSSLFQALYKAHGPSAVGSVRNMILKRGGKSYSIDFYSFFFDGKQPIGSDLRDGDIIILPKAKKLVEANGEFGRPGVYELKNEEGLGQLIRYAGGASAKANRKTLLIERVFEDDRTDYVNVENANAYFTGKTGLRLQNFDKVIVFESSEESKSFFSVGGNAKYPGRFAFKSNMTLGTALKISGGFLSNSLKDRLEVYRKTPTGSWEVHPVNQSDYGRFTLNARDSIHIYSQDSLQNDQFVNITGSVRKAGTYLYTAGMSAQDLIIQAGGQTPEWEQGQIQIERVNTSGEFQVLKADLSKESPELLPKDRLVLLSNPNHRDQEVITLSGAFVRPGSYGKAARNETLSALFKRSGGVQSNAYLDGARFYRSFLKSTDTSMTLCLRKQRDLKPFASTADSNLYGDSLKTICTKQIDKMRDSLVRAVPLNLSAILKGDDADLELQNGDSLYIPTHPISVTVRGAVLAPGEVMYEEGKSESYYIRRAGGYTHNADEDRIVITYANGQKTKAGWFTDNPDAGAEVFVAEEVRDDRWMQIGSFASSVVTGLATATAAIISAIALYSK